MLFSPFPDEATGAQKGELLVQGHTAWELWKTSLPKIWSDFMSIPLFCSLASVFTIGGFGMLRTGLGMTESVLLLSVASFCVFLLTEGFT